MAISALASILTSLNAAKQIAQTMIDVRDAATFQAKVIEFQSKILDAQNSALLAQEERAVLVSRVGELEQKITAMEKWETEKQRYELRKWGKGAFAYILKPDATGSEPVHAVCATCYEGGKKSILQSNGEERITDHYWNCPSCKASVRADSRLLSVQKPLVLGPPAT